MINKRHIRHFGGLIMNTNKKLTLFLTLISGLLINQTVVCAAGAALQAGIWDLRDQGLESLIALKAYNEHHYNNPAIIIKPNIIAGFLNNEIQKNGLDPRLFNYFVSIDQDWEIIKLRNGYGLIIPDSMPSNVDFVLSAFSSTPAQPAYDLNIQDLNRTLTKSDEKRLQEYQLVIVKAIVAAKIKGQASGFGRAIAQSTIAYFGELAKNIEPNLQYVFIALANIYPVITGNQKWIQFQKELDKYVLESLDIKLIKTHIEDLEKQKVSASASTWMSSLGAQSKSAIEKRIETLKNFLVENDLELRLMETIRKKSQQKNN